MDEGHYFTLSREIYTEYNTSGTLPALKMAYMRKHWKPILHPVLAAPFFIFAGGNSLLALTYYLCFIYAIFLMVIYIYLKRYLNAEMTLMGLLTTTCIPWISGTMIGFNSEFTFITASLSFFVITENLKDLSSISKTLTISLCLFFMFALRPVEAALLFSTSIIFFTVQFFLRNLISKIDLVFIATSLGILAALLATPYFIIHREWSVETSTIFLVAYVAYVFLFHQMAIKKKLTLSTNVLLGTALFNVLSLAWYLPSANTLLHWILLTNLGDMAKELGQRLGVSDFIFISNYLKSFGAVCLVFAILFLINFNLRNFKKLIGYALSLLVIPLFFGYISYNGDMRYYIAGWAVIFLLLFSMSLRIKNRFSILSATVSSLVLIILFVHSKHVPYKFELAGLSFEGYIGRSNWFYDKSKSDKSIVAFYNKLSPEIMKSNDYIKMKMFLNDRDFTYEYFIDRHVLEILASEDGKKIFIEKELYSTSKLNFYDLDYVLIGPVDINSKYDSYENFINSFSKSCEIGKEIHADIGSLALKFKKHIDYERQGKVDRFCLFEKI